MKGAYPACSHTGNSAFQHDGKDHGLDVGTISETVATAIHSSHTPSYNVRSAGVKQQA